MLTQVRDLSSGWQFRAFIIADSIFGIVALTMVTITAARYAVNERTLRGFSHIFLGQLTTLAVPLGLLKLAHTAIPQLIAEMTGEAQKLAGATTTMPMDIFDKGLSLASNLLTGSVKSAVITMIPAPFQGFVGQILGVPPSGENIAQAHDLVDNVVNTAVSLNPQVSLPLAEFTIFLGIASALFIVACFAVVATELLLAFVQIYLSASIGAVQLGWSAAVGTSQWAAAYWGMLMHSFIRLAVIYAVVVIGQTIADDWAGALLAAKPSNLMNTLFSICGASLMYALICMRIGNLATHLLDGRPALAANDISYLARSIRSAVPRSRKSA